MATEKNEVAKRTKNENWTLPETERLVEQCISGKGNARHDGSFTAEAEKYSFWVKTAEM